MSEYATVWQSFGALIGVSVASLLYSLGGREGKWKRRFFASLILACTVNCIFALRGTFNPWAMSIYPVLVLGFSLGYSGDTLQAKLFRRLVYALGVLAAGLILCLIYGGNAWILFVPHVGIGLWSIWLGTKNPIEAAAEESLICAALNLCLVFYPFLV